MEDQACIPWASVCIGTYKRPEFLRSTLHTVLSQTFTDYEIIVSDNDPEKSALPIVREFNSSQIRYFSNQKNIGAINNYNKAITNARGKYLQLLSDDDPIAPEMLATLNQLSVEVPGYGAYFGACTVVPDSERIASLYGLNMAGIPSLAPEVPIGSVRCFSAQEFASAFFQYRIFPYMFWSAGVVRREVVTAVGGFPQYGTGYMTDFAYLVLIGMSGGCVTINAPLMCQTVHLGNFGRKEFFELRDGLEKYYKFMADRMAASGSWASLRTQFEKFLGGWTVGHALSVRRLAIEIGSDPATVDLQAKYLFTLPYLKNHYWKYVIKSKHPTWFDRYLQARETVGKLVHRW